MTNGSQKELLQHLQKVTDTRTVLFCSEGDATEESSAHEVSILRSLAEAGIEVHVLSMNDIHYRARLHDEFVDKIVFEPIQFGSKAKTDVRRFAWEVAQKAVAVGADLVLACGLTLCRTLVGNSAVSARLWCLLRSPEVYLHLEKGADGYPYLETIASNCMGLIVESSEVREKLRPVLSSKSMLGTFILGTVGLTDAGTIMNKINVEQLLHMSFSPYRVLFYCERAAESGLPDERGHLIIEDAVSAASELMHVYVLCEGIDHICRSRKFALNKKLSLVQLDPSPRQLESSRVLPRYAAWHLLNAFRKFRCDILITADTEVSYQVAKNEYLGPKLWALIDVQNLQTLSPGAVDRVERVVRRSAKIIARSEDDRSRLEMAFPNATSKTLVTDFGASQGQKSSDDQIFDPISSTALDFLMSRYVGKQQRSFSEIPDKKVLFIGHDFKFAGELIDLFLRQATYSIEIEYSDNQNEVNHESAIRKMNSSDIIFCEFASENAVWCSKNMKPHQKLIIRFHGYELYTDNIHNIVVSQVDMFVFVSEFYMQKVRSELGWPADKCCVIPNMIDALDLHREKLPEAKFQLGMAGVIPRLKRPHLALNLLEILLEEDDRYTLRIRGRLPWEYPWVWRNNSERQYYEDFYRRISSSSLLRRHVVFEEFGPDMGRWLRVVGWMLSPSNRETFHLAPIEGAAAQSVPVVWEREGAEEVFKEDWIHKDTLEAAGYIFAVNASTDGHRVQSTIAGQFANKFDISSVEQRWLNLFAPSGLPYAGEPMHESHD